MRLLINILKWAIATLGALIIGLISFSFILRNRVADILLSSLNKNITTKVIIGHYRLSLIRRFPKAAIELKELALLSSSNFDRNQFGGINTDTLLKAKSVFLEFGMADFLRGNYKVGSISVSGGKLNLFSDSSGGVNYEITGVKDKGNNEKTVVNLEKIVVSGLDIRYINRATSLSISGAVSAGRFKSRIAGSEFDLACNSSFFIEDFELFSSHIKVRAAASIDLNLHQSDTGIIFRKGLLRLENFKFGLKGFINSSDRMDLRITGQNIQLSNIKKYLPDKYASEFAEYSPEGLLKTECRLSGLISRKNNPSVNITFSLANGSITYRKSNIHISDLNFSGDFSNGNRQRPETSVINIDNYHFRLGSALWSGNISLLNLSHPEIHSVFSGEIIPRELIQFFPVPGIVSSDGSARVNLSLDGQIEKKDKYNISDFIRLDPKGDIRFNSFSFRGKDNSFSVEDADGDIMFARYLWTEDLYFSWQGQRFKVNGEFRDIPEYLTGKPVRIKAIADISADNFNPSFFIPDSSSVKKGNASSVMFPDWMEADISFSLNNLAWDTFEAEKITGFLRYRPGRIDIKPLIISALDGNTEGDCFLVQNKAKGFLAHGNFRFYNIDINKTFRSFRNFGQNFIVAENLSGSLSGNLSLLLPLDSVMKPESSGVNAEGKYVIANGALINFEPAKELSDYIEVSELQNITFSQLENELFIRDKYVAIPQMDIKSSAADFTVSGKHWFDDSYEYHVRTYLSYLLSKKAKNGKRYSDEFGAVEDDGLGRTAIFLKITGKDEDLKVAYDLKAAGNNVKQNLKKEKGNLKSILNEEYGWFRHDSTIKKDDESRTRFRIVFPETDTAAVLKDSTLPEKDRRINRIFKKKFNLAPLN